MQNQSSSAVKITGLFTWLAGSSVGIALATGWTVQGSNLEGARFSAPVQTGPGAHPASCTIGTGSFLGVKSGLGVTLTPHPLLVPWSWKGTTIHLLPLWALWPVLSPSACTRVHFTCLLTLTGWQEVYNSDWRNGKDITVSELQPKPL